MPRARGRARGKPSARRLRARLDAGLGKVRRWAAPLMLGTLAACLRFRRPPGGGRRASGLNARTLGGGLALIARFPCSEHSPAASSLSAIAPPGRRRIAAFGGHGLWPRLFSSFRHPDNRFRPSPPAMPAMIPAEWSEVEWPPFGSNLLRIRARASSLFRLRMSARREAGCGPDTP